MTVYTELLRSTKEFKSLSQHLSSIGKIRAKTEDERLVRLIDLLALELQQAHAISKTKSTPIAISDAKERAMTDLLKYCQQAIGTKKPEWQILAERNGWSPPEA